MHFVSVKNFSSPPAEITTILLFMDLIFLLFENDECIPKQSSSLVLLLFEII